MQTLVVVSVLSLAGVLALCGVWAIGETETVESRHKRQRSSQVRVNARMIEIGVEHPEWSSLQVLQAAEETSN